MKDQETFLELGLVMLIVGLAAAASFWVAGRALGRGRHSRGRAAAPPAAGTVAAIRHQHIGSVAAR